MAQGLNSAYFTKDYKFRHTMNPALANEQNYVSIPALGSINVNLRGNFGYQDVIMDNPMYPATSDKKMTTFMNPYISVADALDGFSSGRNRIVGDVSIMVLSAGFRAFGGYNNYRTELTHVVRHVFALRTLRVCKEHRQPHLRHGRHQCGRYVLR